MPDHTPAVQNEMVGVVENAGDVERILTTASQARESMGDFGDISSNRYTVLVVGAGRITLDRIAGSLERENVRVIHAENIAKSAEYMLKAEPEVVICDLKTLADTQLSRLCHETCPNSILAVISDWGRHLQTGCILPIRVDHVLSSSASASDIMLLIEMRLDRGRSDNAWI
jgi:DNA-binding NarL/FixJ family response regulator